MTSDRVRQLFEFGVFFTYLPSSIGFGYALTRDPPEWVAPVFVGLSSIFFACGVHYLADSFNYHSSLLSAFVFLNGLVLVFTAHPGRAMTILKTAKEYDARDRRSEAIRKSSPIAQAVVHFEGERLVVDWHTEALLQFVNRSGSVVGLDWYSEIFPEEIKAEWKEDHRRAAQGEYLANERDYWPSRNAYLFWVLKPMQPGELMMFFWDVTMTVDVTTSEMESNLVQAIRDFQWENDA